MSKKLLSKTICFLLFTFILSFRVHAQLDSLKINNAKNALLASACSCVTNIDTSLIKSGPDAGVAVAKCLYADSSDFFNYIRLNGFTDFKKDDPRAVKIGMDLLLEVFSKCPAVMSLMQELLLKKP